MGNSSSYEAMCLYQRAAWGYFVSSGEDEIALKQATSACDAELLLKL